MNDAIKKTIEAMASDILQLSKKVMQQDEVGINPKTGKNTLINSKMYKNIQSLSPRDLMTSSGDSIVLDALFEHYSTYMEWERPKEYGKKPPIDSLREWALERGIPTDNGTLWAISTAIWRDGHAARPVMATLEREIEQYMDSKGTERLYETITEEITKYFN